MADEKKNNKKHYTVRPYITTPLVFVLIALLVVAPMCFGLLHYAVNTVHKAQTVYIRSVADISLKDESYQPANDTEGTVKLPAIYVGNKIAQLTCEEAGINCSVYYGNNRVARREAAGLSTQHQLMGESGTVLIGGDTAGAFRNLETVKKGDTVVLRSNWGTFTYRVTGRKVLAEEPESEGKELLLLTTQKDKDAFADFSKEKLYVICEKVSGPQLGEVKR